MLLILALLFCPSLAEGGVKKKKDFRKELRVIPLHLAKGKTFIQLQARKRLA